MVTQSQIDAFYQSYARSSGSASTTNIWQSSMYGTPSSEALRYQTWNAASQVAPYVGSGAYDVASSAYSAAAQVQDYLSNTSKQVSDTVNRLTSPQINLGIDPVILVGAVAVLWVIGKKR